VTTTLGQAVGGLPAPLSAGTATAQTVVTGDGQTAGAAGGVTNLGVNLAKLPLSIPTPTLPAGLGAVPVTATGNLATALGQLGLPTSGTVDVRPAVLALINATLPNVDLVDVQGAVAYAWDKCASGQPQLGGSSQVTGLSLLGQNLPVLNQTVTQAVNLLNAQTIALSSIDLSRVVLPAGWSFSLPSVAVPPLPLPPLFTVNVGLLLQQAVQSALASLPAVQVPATVAQASATPGQQSSQGGQLTQNALHLQVTALGQTLVDLVLGEARMAQSAVTCGLPAVVAPAPAAAPTPTAGPTAPQAALECTTRKLTLIDVLARSDHVDLVGAADPSLVGRTVTIYFGGAQRVASAVVRPDGSFRTTAPLPADDVRHTNSARYEARAGSERSLDLKLERRLVVRSMSAHNGLVTIRGRVTPPLTRPVSSIAIQRRVSCTQLVTVAGWRSCRRLPASRRLCTGRPPGCARPPATPSATRRSRCRAWLTCGAEKHTGGPWPSGSRTSARRVRGPARAVGP
jgi:hypothetical protein